MARATARIGLIQVVIGLGMIAVLARAAQLPALVEGAEWRARAEAARQGGRCSGVARRGRITGCNGVPLAITQGTSTSASPPTSCSSRATMPHHRRALGMPLE
ncbi:MAG: hypothetical protein U0133_04710 [Gemmatimonadales bacterium]